MERKSFPPLTGHDAHDFARMVNGIFIEMAISDWIAARVLFANGLYRQFAWCAAQGLEKAVKAALLLNWRSAKFSHDFAGRFPTLVAASQGLLPERVPVDFPCTEFLQQDRVAAESFNECLRRFAKNGAPDVRYGSTDTLVLENDVFRCDFLMKHLLRHCTDLDEQVGGKSVRMMLSERPDAYPFDLNHFVKRLKGDMKGMTTRETFSAFNYALPVPEHDYRFPLAMAMSVSASDTRLYQSAAAKKYLEENSCVKFSPKERPPKGL